MKSVNPTTHMGQSVTRMVRAAAPTASPSASPRLRQAHVVAVRLFAPDGG